MSPNYILQLLKAGMDVNIRGDYDDCTPLHMAAWSDNPEAAKTLIDNGAGIDLNTGEIHNNSPAGWAIVAGSADTLEVLFDHGAEMRDYYLRDAKLALDGEFKVCKASPQENYERVLALVKS